MNNNVMITGADGFIGNNLCKYLAQNGFRVYAIVRKNSINRYKIEDIGDITIIESELYDIDYISKMVPKNFLALIHLAWCGVEPESRNSFTEQRVNIDLINYAVNLANTIHARRFLFPGSTFEYIYYGLKINKDAKPSPQDLYGATKIAGRYYAQVLCNKFEIDYIYLVISGIYAPDRNDNNVINYTINKLINGQKPSLTKLEQLWDYVYIDDVVAAIEAIMTKGRRNGFYTVGHGDNWPLLKYINIIRDYINPDLELGIGDIPYNDDVMPMSCVDISDLINDTGYAPKVDFETGISIVINKRMEYMKKESKDSKKDSLL